MNRLRLIRIDMDDVVIDGGLAWCSFSINYHIQVPEINCVQYSFDKIDISGLERRHRV
jgi:hypothetical protein